MRNKATLTAKIITKATTLLVVVAIFVTNLPLDILGRGIERLINEANVVDIAWKASRDPNVVDSFPSLRGLAKQLRTRGALAAAQGDGKIFYSIAANTTPRTRDYVATTNSFNSAASTVAGGTALQSSIKASPTKDEYIAGYVNSAGTLQVMCYDGASWTNEWSVSVGGTGTTRRFDIAYEKTSGDVMVVYGTNAATTNELAYRTKAGSSACGSANWSGATNYDAVRTSGIVHWVRAEGSPASGSNTIAVAWADANADLSAMEWTGASFAVAEPAAALETSLEFVTAAQDVQSFDIAFESTSGELMVAWGLTQATSCTAGTAIATTNCIRYATYTNAWSSVAAIPTVADPATHLDMSGNPNTNEIVLASVDNSQADVSAAYWSGSAWTGQANIDITAQAATAGTKFVATGWLIAGATTRSVITYYDSATTNVGWIVGNAGSFAAQTDFAPTPVFGAQRQYAIDMDPFNKDRLIFTVGDTNSDVFAKRLIMTSTPGFTWSNADGGAALEANTGSNIYRTADFEYARYIPVTTTLATGSDPASTTVAPESGIVDAGQFTFQASSGTDSITGLNVTLAGAGTPYDGVSEVRITSSDGLTTYFTAIANPSSNSLSFSGGTPIPVTSSVATFKIRVTPKTHANMAAPSGASYALSPLVSNWTGTNAHGGSDTNANTLTIDNLSPANVTSATATAGDTQVSLSWTNPVDGDLSQIVILRRATSAVADVPVEGGSYSVGNTIGTATVACVVSSPTATCNDTSLTNGTAYHYKIFAKDSRGNYSATGVVPTGSPATPVGVTTTLGDGAAGSNVATGPGTTGFIDNFTFQTDAGTDSVTALTVTLAAGVHVGLSEVRIMGDDETTTYFTAVTDPASNVVNFSGGTPIPVTTSSTQFKVRVTAKSATNMPAPSGALYSVTGTVTAFTSTNAQAGTDATSGTFTIDNLSPANVTSATATAGDTQVSLSWTNPGDADLRGYIVLRRAGVAVSDVPTEGANYFAPTTLGSSDVVCSWYAGGAVPTTCNDTGLTNGTAYHYKIFTIDNWNNYSATGVVPTGSPATPIALVTTLGNGTNPSSTTLAPGGSITDLDSFTLQVNGGTDSVTALTVTLAAGTHLGLSEVRITSDTGATTYFSAVANPASNVVNFSGGTPIPVTTSSTQFKVRITPKSHINMPPPAGLSYVVTGTVTAFTSTNSQAGSDSGSATITIDNLSPANVTSATATAGDTQVSLSWTNPVDGDLSQIVILRRATSAVADVPVEGGSYSVGNTIGTATVACVVSSPTATCNDTSLTNGTAYHYKIFAKDSRGNYSATGVVPTGSPATPNATPVLTIGATGGLTESFALSGATSVYVQPVTCASVSECAVFHLSISTGSETVTSIKITEIGTVNADVDLANLALFYDTDGNFANGVIGQYGSTVASFSASAATVNGSLAITSGTTYYFYVRYDLRNGSNNPKGGQTTQFRIAANSDVGTSGSPTKTGAPASFVYWTVVTPQITGYTNSTEPALDYSAACTGCGARIGGGAGFRQTLTISGYGFGSDPGLGSRDLAANRIRVGGSVVIADDGTSNTNVTSWASSTIVIRTDSSIAGNADSDWGSVYGGAGALTVAAGSVESSGVNFYLFPQITSMTQPAGLAADTAREYAAGDSDGALTLNGTRLGSSQGTGYVRILGCDSSTCSSPTGSATINSWTSTAIAVRVPTVIGDNTYTGSISMQQGTGANSKTATYANTLRILPRITGIAPSGAAVGDAVTVSGDHFCQNGGVCPLSFSASNKVAFTGADATVFTSWSSTAMATQVPVSASTGNVTLTSNAYASNAYSFTIADPTPISPSGVFQYRDSGSLDSIATGGLASSTPVYFTQTMQSTVSGGTLYPQFEYKPIGTPFTCSGTGACGSAVEGTGAIGPGPAVGQVSASPTDNVYHWQARTRHNKNSVDYYSAWVSYPIVGTNLETETDFAIDTVAPAITSISSGSPASNSATITWSTLVEPSTSQVQYNKTGSFVTNCATNSDCTALDASLVTSHSVSLSNLDSGTTYYYRVRSKDAAGNESISSMQSFATASVLAPAKTLRFGIDGLVGTVSGGTATSSSFIVHMPETSPTIKSAFVEIRAVYTTNGSAPNGVTVQVNGEASKTYAMPATSHSGSVRILHPVASLSVDPSTNTLTVTPQTNMSLNVLSSDVTVTYSFTP